MLRNVKGCAFKPTKAKHMPQQQKSVSIYINLGSRLYTYDGHVIGVLLTIY